MKKDRYNQEVEEYRCGMEKGVRHPATQEMQPPTPLVIIEREIMQDKTEEYQDALRRGTVCHLDRVGFKTDYEFTEKTLEMFHRVLMSVYGKVRKPTPQEIKQMEYRQYRGMVRTKTLFKQRARIVIDENAVVVIDFERRGEWSPNDKKQAVLWMTWKIKGDYTNWSSYLREMEGILRHFGGNWTVWYVEIDMDTTLQYIGKSLFDHTLVKGLRKNDIRHWDDKQEANLRGVSAKSINTYQNLETHRKRQLSNHVMDRPTDYKDLITGSWIFRSEIRLKREAINPLDNKSISEIIKDAEKIYNKNVLWRAIKYDGINKIRFTLKEKRLIERDSVLYWVWQLIRKKISMNKIRSDYLIEYTPMRPVLTL